MFLKWSPKKLATISLCALVLSCISGWFLIPKVIKWVLLRNVQLRKGSQMRPLFERIPFPLTFKAYVFNLTNPDDVLIGIKPKLQEIGPFVFDEWKLRENIMDDDFRDTVTYTLRQRFIFRPDLSAGLTGDEEIIFPNLVTIASTMTVKKEREAFLPMVIKANQLIFGESASPFVRIRIMDMLFNGMEFNCSGNNFAIRTTCAAIKAEGERQGIRTVNQTHMSISLLGHKNETDIGRFTILRGVQRAQDLGRIIKINDDHIQSIWDGDECNRFRGTDSTIFPPFLRESEGLWTFTPDICMSTRAHFVRKSSYAGLPSSYYSLKFEDFKTDETKHCFCNDPPDECPPAGTIDLTACLGSRIFGSKPHFLDADKALLDAVEGLAPHRSKHDVYVNFEAISGTPLSGRKRLQFSLAIEPIEQYEALSQLPELLFPLFWVEEGVDLNKTYTNMLKYQLFLALKANTAMKWIGIVCGSIGVIAAGVMMYSGRGSTVSVTPTTTVRTETATISTIERVAENLDNPIYLKSRIDRASNEVNEAGDN